MGISGQPTVATDFPDYAPGDTAIITASDFTVGGAVTFQVLHADGAGGDGLWGTADDLFSDSDLELNTTSSGHEKWTVVDGGADDLDGVADGQVVTSWHIDPADSLWELFRLTAEGSGDDGEQGTGDDQAAATSFTDAVDVDFSAADPTLYPRLTYSQVVGLIPIGFGDDPIPGAGGGATVTVESLNPQDLALGQVVPFEFRIDVPNDVDSGEIIRIVAGWDTETTPGDLFGFDGTLGMIAAFVDRGDTENTDADATVSATSWTLVGSEIQGTFDISNATAGEVIVVEAWVVLQDTLPSGVSGVVQSRIISGDIIGGDGGTFNEGTQTIPLKPDEFGKAEADLSVIKSDTTVVTAGDDPKTVSEGETITYTIIAKNNSDDTVSNGVTITDTLDPDVTFVPGSVTVTDSEGVITTATDFSFAAGVLTGDLGFLNPGEEVTITFQATVNDTTPDRNERVNTVEIESSVTEDDNPDNNVNEEPTAVVAVAKDFTIVKSVTDVGGDGADGKVDAEGDVITYEIAVENTGDVALSNLVVTDQVESLAATDATYLSGDENDNDVFDAGETWIYGATYVATQDDIDGGGGGDGFIDNVATATTTEVGPKTDDAQVEVVRTPGIDVEKVGHFVDANGNNVADAGETINYVFTVENTGNVTLTDVKLSDLNHDVVFVDDPLIGTLAPGQVVDIDAYLKLVYANILIGTKPNTAVVTGLDGETEVKDTDSVLTVLPRGEDISLNGNANNNLINGGAGSDTLKGLAGNDTINGKEGADSLYGGADADLVQGDGGADKLFGEAGADVLVGGAGEDTVSGGADADTIRGGVDADSLAGDGGEDSILGGAGNDTIFGGDENDKLFGGGNRDLIAGDAGDDTLVGEGGADTLIGGSGSDQLDGGVANDIFRLLAAGDSTAAARDVILGFDQPGAAAGDRIDLAAIDANEATVANEAFNSLIMNVAFTGFSAVRQLLIVDDGADAIIYGNTDAVFSTAEFEILVKNVDHASFITADFIL